MERKIPIKNIYYMLCYAWDRLDEKDIVDIDASANKDIYELFTRIMINSLNYLIKRGFYREYSSLCEENRYIRGKINFNESLKRLSFVNGKAFCEYDELNYNIIHNQIIKTTIIKLLNCKELDNNLKENLMVLYKYFIYVDEIKINNNTFKNLKLNKNNNYYGLVIDICEIIFKNILVDEKSGEIKFKNFYEDDKQMAYLFENFVRNFYKRELKGYKVFRENIKWDTDNNLYDNNDFLPIMQTDITLESNERKIIIDTKYYKEALNINYNNKKVRSENLYQLFSYVKNNEQKGGVNLNSEGILIYPMVSENFNFDFFIQGHNIKVRTINLKDDWEKIHERLLNIL